MNLFTSELFHPVMSPPPARRNRTPAFGRRYGRAADRLVPEVSVRLTACTVGRIDQDSDLLAYDQAA